MASMYTQEMLNADPSLLDRHKKMLTNWNSMTGIPSDQYGVNPGSSGAGNSPFTLEDFYRKTGLQQFDTDQFGTRWGRPGEDSHRMRGLSEDELRPYNDQYDFLTTSKDAKGRLRYGTDLSGVRQTGSGLWGQVGAFDPVEIGGKRYVRSESGFDEMGSGGNPTLTKFMREMGVRPEHFLYDDRYGNLMQEDVYEPLMTKYAATQKGGLTDMLTNMPKVLGTIGMTMGLGGAFPGVDALGNFIPAGQTSIWSQLGMNNPFSSLFSGGDQPWAVGPERTPFGTGPDFDWGSINELWGGGPTAADGAAAFAGASAAGSGSTGLGFLSGLFSPSSLLSAGGNIFSSLMGSNAAKKAAGIQADAAAGSNALLRDIYLQNRADLEPWRQAGVNALTRLAKVTTPGSQLSEMELDPGYRFRLDEGLKGIERSAAARGLLQSGGTLKGVNNYAQQSASGEYGNVVNRLMAQAGMGQSATNSGVQAGQNYGNQAANNLTSAGNARASGYVGSANAMTSGVGNFLNSYMQNQIINRLIPEGF